MEISAQSIQTVGGQSGPLAMLVAGLKPGDSLTAQILARNPAGLALVALAGKQVQMPLPPTLPPGTLLKLTVQQGQNGLQFLIETQAGTTQGATRPAVTLPQAPATTTTTAPGGAAPPASGGPAQPAVPAP
ncbi:MAG: hypothetical protein KKH72_07680, partial [Alphaproteobacteria bacterium]|nr:hypothetical protein [Alphaproteobacteria bacterium]